MAQQFALGALALGMATSSADGQTVVTNGCIVITFPPNQTNIVCAAGWVIDDYAVGVSNRCSGGTTSQVEVQCQPPPGAMIPVGVQEVYCRASTNGIVFASRPFLRVVESALPLPFVQSPSNQVVIAPCVTNCAPATYDQPAVTGGTMVECSPPSGTCFPIGFNRVTCTATNQCGSAASIYFSITVTRETPLSIVYGSPSFGLLAPCASNCVPVTYTLPVVTNGTLISCTPPSGACFPQGYTDVICRATNECGDRLSCGFFIRVIAEPPVIQCPTNALYVFPPCDMPCVAVNYALPEVMCGTIECIPPPGTCFPAPGPPGGSTVYTILCRATNDDGLRTACAFDIRLYQDPMLFAPPWFGWPPVNLIHTNECGSGCVPVLYRPPIAVHGSVRGCNPPPGACLPVGTHLVRCWADNGYCGAITNSFYVRVVQGSTPPPVITLRIVPQGSFYRLYWENLCGPIGLLETSDKPDGPWETLPGAGPGYLVHPTEFKRYFRVIVPE